MMLSRDDVIWVYRILLCRDPESEHLITCYQKDFDNINDLRSHILRSEEFRQMESIEFVSRRVSNDASRDEVLSALKLLFQNNFRALDDAGSKSMILSRMSSDFIAKMASVKDIRLVLIFGDSPLVASLIESLLSLNVPPIAIIQLMPSNAVASTYQIRPGILKNEHSTILACVNLGFDLFTSIVEKIPSRFDFIYIASFETALATVSRFYGRLEETGVFLIERPSDPNLVGYVHDLRAFAASYMRDIIVHEDVIAMPKSYWYSGLKIEANDRSTSLVKPTVKLALAVIVKNEEAKIRQMLDSVAEIVSFISIVDTGSTDSTVMLVNEWLASHDIDNNVLQVPFVDFSQSRNLALASVPDCVDWILMLDADEYLEKHDAIQLVELLYEDAEGWAIPRYNYSDENKSVEPLVYPDRQKRLFRNRPENPYRFKGAVHEVLEGVTRWELAPANFAAIGGAKGGPHIHHTGLITTYERWLEKHLFYQSLGASA